jgi:hypothetical protein
MLNPLTPCAEEENNQIKSAQLQYDDLKLNIKELERIFYIEALIIGASDILDEQEKTERLSAKLSSFEKIAKTYNISFILSDYCNSDKYVPLKNYLVSVFKNKHQSIEDIATELFAAFINLKKGLLSENFNIKAYAQEIKANIVNESSIKIWNDRVSDPLLFYANSTANVEFNDDLCKEYAKQYRSYFFSGEEEATSKLTQEDINRLLLINSALETFLNKNGSLLPDVLTDLSDWLCAHKSLHELFFSDLGLKSEEEYKTLTQEFEEIYRIP